MTRLRDLARTLAATTTVLVSSGAVSKEPVVGGPCEGCEAVFEGKPAELASLARIAPAGEPGEPMRVSGRVLAADGQPRENVIVYAYHTDARGIYPLPSKSHGRASDRHGRLRSWAISDRDGRYAFETIRPASYPSRSIPAHIHMHVIEPGCATYYIDDIQFTDDPLLSEAARSRPREARAGGGIVTPVRRGPTGEWSVVRDIRLGINIPNYPDCGKGT
jgi:protocatechuate 3,4-dioxygenase beta subunit